MPPLSYSGYRFPRDIIQRAVWMYLRFTLSFRDVEELLAERGIVVTYESIRRWVLTFGPAIARRLRARRPRPHGRWHLDEMVVRIDGKQMYLWRAVDAEGEVLDVLLQAKRDTKAARKLMRKLLKRQGMAPEEWVTDKCPALWRCSSRAEANQDPSHPAQAGQQSSRKLSRSDTATRTQAARVQVAPVSPAVPVLARGHLQHFHRSPPPSPLVHTDSSEPRFEVGRNAAGVAA